MFSVLFTVALSLERIIVVCICFLHGYKPSCWWYRLRFNCLGPACHPLLPSPPCISSQLSSIFTHRYGVACPILLPLPAYLLFFVCVCVCLAVPHGLWDLSSLTRDRTLALGTESTVLTIGPPGNSCHLQFFPAP